MPLSFTADLHAELLTSDGRVPLARVVTLPGDVGVVREVRVPDGTVGGTLVAATTGRLHALVVTSDKAVRVRVGQVMRNADTALDPGGVLALVGIDTPAFGPCTVTYTPGDGSVATCLVLALIGQPPPVQWSEPWEAYVIFHPVSQWTEPWES